MKQSIGAGDYRGLRCRHLQFDTDARIDLIVVGATDGGVAVTARIGLEGQSGGGQIEENWPAFEGTSGKILLGDDFAPYAGAAYPIGSGDNHGVRYSKPATDAVELGAALRTAGRERIGVPILIDAVRRSLGPTEASGCQAGGDRNPANRARRTCPQYRDRVATGALPGRQRPCGAPPSAGEWPSARRSNEFSRRARVATRERLRLSRFPDPGPHPPAFGRWVTPGAPPNPNELPIASPSETQTWKRP